MSNDKLSKSCHHPYLPASAKKLIWQQFLIDVELSTISAVLLFSWKFCPHDGMLIDGDWQLSGWLDERMNCWSDNLARRLLKSD